MRTKGGMWWAYMLTKLKGLLTILSQLSGVRGLAFVRFTSADVVRHPLVQKIINAYELHTKSERIDAPSDTPPGGR